MSARKTPKQFPWIRRIRTPRVAFLLAVAWSGTTASGEPVVLAPGFVLTEEAAGLTHPTQITFSPEGRLYIATQDGEILACDYHRGGILGKPATVAVGVGIILLGIGFDSDGYFYASSNEGDDDTGFIARLLDEDGDGFHETHQHFVTHLPNKVHHNDQIAIDGKTLYVGMGSRNDDGTADDVEPVPAATLLRVDLRSVDFDSPDNLPWVEAYGLRNAFGITLDEQHRVWVGDNGRDTPLLPDELDMIVPGAHYGFPDELAPPDAIPPVLTLGLGTSADGLDFYPTGGPWDAQYWSNIFLARFDWELNDPAGVGQDVVRIIIDESIPGQPTATQEVFADDFLHPLDVEADPFGNLLVMEYGGFGSSDPAHIYRIAPLVPSDTDADGDVDLHDFARFQTCFTGPDAGRIAVGCESLDSDADIDIDLEDYGAFQSAITGP